MNIFEAIDHVDATSLILSTGQKPESKKDLLVVGELTRGDFHSSILGVTENTEGFISDDAVILPGEGRRIGVAYYDVETFVNTTRQIAEGTLVDPVGKQWSVGPWLPETFASDIDRSIEMKAGTYLNKDAANIFSSYPDGLRAAIINRTQAEIALKSVMVISETDGLSKNFAEAELCLAALRCVYAQYRTYFRGIKYEPQTRSTLPLDMAEVTDKIVSSGKFHDVDLLKFKSPLA